MATYNKRGYKPQTKEQKVDETQQHSTTAEVFNTLDESASKTEAFIAKNQKYIFILIGVVATVVLGYMGYNEFIAKPSKITAMNDMAQAQKYYNEAVNATASTTKDSLFMLALKGGEGKFGMLDIIKQHNGTPAANIANYCAGTAYLNLKDYKKAIDFLSDFKPDDEILAPLAKGNIGDAFAQLNQSKDALEYYEQAAEMRNNEYTTPMYLYKAGAIALELGDANKALTFFNKIKENYSKSSEAATIDVFIAKAQVLANK